MQRQFSLCLLTACLTLTGCSTSTPPSVRPELPANLTQPCPDPAELVTDSWDALAIAYVELVTDYGECAARHRAVVKAWPS